MDEIRKVEGVVVDDTGDVVWDPKTQQDHTEQSSIHSATNFSTRSFVLKAALAFVLLPILAIFAFFALVFLLIAFFLGKPVKVYKYKRSASKIFRGV